MKLEGAGTKRATAKAVPSGKGNSDKAGGAQATGKKKYRRISVEEHFSTPDHMDNLRLILEKKYPSPEVIEQERFIGNDVAFLSKLDTPRIRNRLVQLYDLGSVRIGDMDAQGIDVQVISLTAPGVQVFEPSVGIKLARKYNDILSAAVREHPERLAGLACLDPQSPDEAADELERAVLDLGLKGAVINSHTKGEYLDDRKFWAIFARAQRLQVPIYLHPRGPSPSMMKPYLGYPMLSTSMWGFSAETSLHAMRLICSGLFDEYPGLKIILGHLGETIPFMLQRIDTRWASSPEAKRLKKLPGQYFRENFLVSMSGMTSPEALVMTLSVLGADRIMFATDYPVESPRECVAFLDGAPITAADRKKIYQLNAERVFSL